MVGYDALWADVVRADLDDIAYIAEEVVLRMKRKASKLVSMMPERGVIVPDLFDIGVLQYQSVD